MPIHHQFRARTGLFGGAAFAALLLAPGISLAAAATSSDTATLEELIITATRREGTLRDAPAAVSAYGGDQLAARHVTDVAALTSLVPNLQFGASYSEARVTIRGIGTNNVNGGADPGVAYHLDGVYVGNTGPASNAFFDVSRIEVLRGPQGTLFGQNATGGSINLIPNRPTAEPGGSIGVTLGADPFLYAVEGVLNGPLNSDGSLSGRLSLLRNYNEGYAKNLAPTGPRRLDDDDSIGVRGQLLFRPTDDFELHGVINYSKADANGGGTQLLGRGGRSGLPTVAETLGGVKPPLDSHDVYANLGYAKGEFLLAAIDSALKAGPGTLKLTLSGGRTQSDAALDGDGTAVAFTSSDVHYVARQWFGEALYDVKPIAKLDLILGANAYYQELDQIFNVPVAYIFGPTPVTVSLGGHLQTTTYAAFAHAEYHLTDAIKVFGGARYTFDRKAYHESNNFIGTAAGTPNWDRLTYEFGVSAALTDKINAYLKYATGFKGGGLQLGTISKPVNPETNASTEAGIKGLFLDRTLEANFAVFHMPYDDLQLTRVAGFATGFQNAAKATVDGAELESAWRPSRRLRLEFSGSLLNAKFDRFESADPSEPNAVVQNLAGRYLPNTPRSAFSLGGYYDLDAVGGTLTLGARYYWQDKSYLTEFNTPFISQDAVGRLDLTADWASAKGDWRASAFARNLTDEVVRGTGLVASNLLGAPALVTLEPGRTVGISLKRIF